MIACNFPPITLKSDSMPTMLCLSNRIEKLSNLFKFTSYCSSMDIINFLPRETKFVTFAVHVESVAIEYVCFSNHAGFRFDK